MSYEFDMAESYLRLLLGEIKAFLGCRFLLSTETTLSLCDKLRRVVDHYNVCAALSAVLTHE